MSFYTTHEIRRRRKKNKKVEMFEIVSINLPNQDDYGYTGLETIGLNPCIAICMRITNQNRTLLGMYHWPGDPTISKKDIDYIYQNSDNEMELSAELDILHSSIKKSAKNALADLHEHMQEEAKKINFKLYDENTSIEIEIIGGGIGTEKCCGSILEFKYLIHKAQKLLMNKKYHNKYLSGCFSNKHQNDFTNVCMQKQRTFYEVFKLNENYDQEEQDNPLNTIVNKKRARETDGLDAKRLNKKPKLTYLRTI